MRKEITDLIHEAMDQHELARDFYHRMAHRVSHADTRETFEYLAEEAEENKARLHHCLTPESCPMVPPVHDVHLTEHLKVPKVTEGMPPKEALAAKLVDATSQAKALEIRAGMSIREALQKMM